MIDNDSMTMEESSMYRDEQSIFSPIINAQDIVMAGNKEELQKAMGQLHLNCMTNSVEAFRDFNKYLATITQATLMDRVREAVEAGHCSKEAAIALADEEKLSVPILALPILSDTARDLAVEVEELASLEEYCHDREEILAELEEISRPEAEAISQTLYDSLDSLLIYEVLEVSEETDKLLTHQLRLWKILQTARKAGQLEMAAYFMTQDEGGDIQSLLPCCIPVGAPVVVFYKSASVLKVLAYQKDVWEYDVLVESLHDKVEKEVLSRVLCGKNDEDTNALNGLFALLHAVKVSHNILPWEYSYFENMKKHLESTCI